MLKNLISDSIDYSDGSTAEFPAIEENRAPLRTCFRVSEAVKKYLFRGG